MRAQSRPLDWLVRRLWLILRVYVAMDWLSRRRMAASFLFEFDRQAATLRVCPQSDARPVGQIRSVTPQRCFCFHLSVLRSFHLLAKGPGIYQPSEESGTVVLANLARQA